MYTSFLKPLIDFIAAIVLLLFFSPILLLVCILIFAVSRNNPIFLQVRPGYKGKPFTIVKFKTMTDEKDVNGVLLADEKRLTLLGRLIRKTSIDELPQLINVIKGDVSLVGPRPLLMRYLPRYNIEQARRHDVKPGITGWSQVNGRDAISWDKKFDLDIYYVDHISFGLDLKILFKTIFNVLMGKDETPVDAEIMEEFWGNEK
jgi:lipopolysaccharide/colanic/teichoic acid biosynthesis glycosyltransferase